MASAQRWVDNQCCRCVLPCPAYKTPISGHCSDLTVWYVGICDVKCWILLTCFVYMAIYDLEIQLFHSFSVLENCFSTFSYFQLRLVGYIASYKLNFQNWQHVSSQGVPLKMTFSGTLTLNRKIFSPNRFVKKRGITWFFVTLFAKLWSSHFSIAAILAAISHLLSWRGLGLKFWGWD